MTTHAGLFEARSTRSLGVFYRTPPAPISPSAGIGEAGDLQSAIESYRRAQTLDADTGEAQRQTEWAEGRLAPRAHPVSVPLRALVSYAGRYQRRAITMRAGRLFYDGGAKPESPLIPMAEDLFEVEADPTVRIRVLGGGVGPAARLIEIYSDGSIEEMVRSR